MTNLTVVREATAVRQHYAKHPTPERLQISAILASASIQEHGDSVKDIWLTAFQDVPGFDRMVKAALKRMPARASVHHGDPKFGSPKGLPLLGKLKWYGKMTLFFLNLAAVIVYVAFRRYILRDPDA